MGGARGNKQKYSNADRYEKARQLAEDALEAFAKGDDESARDLIKLAKHTDKTAIEDVLQELDEDAASNHDVQGDAD